MESYWKDFEQMTITYSFEAYCEKSGYSEGDTFEDFESALYAFNQWTLEEKGAATSKRVCVNINVPTVRGEYDLFKSETLLQEEYGEPSPYLSITEAAELLGVSRQRVFVLVTNGHIDGVKIGDTWIITRKSVEKRRDSMRQK